jgi:hypothetical protein
MSHTDKQRKAKVLDAASAPALHCGAGSGAPPREALSTVDNFRIYDPARPASPLTGARISR